MAFDGFTTAAIVADLQKKLTGGGISRIVQSEKDELLITVKSNKVQYRLLMSASASLPLIYLIPENKQAPLTAPNFCMLLRKHLQGGQILSITQPSLERVIRLEIGHRDELGDPCVHFLTIELMGKYSNIILTDASGTIVDSIKRVPATMSSVREVLPGRPYFIPGTDEKADPLTTDRTAFAEKMKASPYDVVKAFYMTFTGFSPLAAEELVYEAGLDARMPAASLDEEMLGRLADQFMARMEAVREGQFTLSMVMDRGVPREYAVFPLRIYAGLETRSYDDISSLLIAYYGEKESANRIRQKSADLRHVVTTALDRTNKKCILQEKQLKDTEKKDRYRIYGEMINAFGYGTEEGAKVLNVINYYDGQPLAVPLDPTLTPSENAQKYFDRYNKLKRTAEALGTQIEETYADREQLEACLTAIDLAETEADLTDIRRELTDFGFVQRKGQVTRGKVRETKSRPLVFISSDGFKMVVGRNNLQNEEVSFRIAGGSDWWFHAKGQPGSHVIIKAEGREVPDRTFEEAGALAAYYSKGRRAPKVEIDYTQRKNLRKKNGGKPGFVIYHTNYSLMATPDISGIRQEKQ